MKGIFVNNNNQVRSGWKIAVALASYITFSVVIGMVISIVAGIVIFITGSGSLNTAELTNKINGLINNNPYMSMAMQTIDFAGLMLMIYIWLRVFDKKKFADIGLTKVKHNYREFIYGLLMGAVSMTVIFLILYFTKNISLKSTAPDFNITALTGLILFIFVGIKEEVLSRGYCITVLNQMKKPWLSVIISSVLFSALHLGNNNVKVFGLINIILVGILFGVMYVKTNNLWMPIGYHITWNYFQGSVFGLPVSGGGQPGIFTVSSFNDNILTGGGFGPEAGVLTTIIILIGMFIVWRFYKNDRAGSI